MKNSDSQAKPSHCRVAPSRPALGLFGREGASSASNDARQASSSSSSNNLLADAGLASTLADDRQLSFPLLLPHDDDVTPSQLL